MEGGLKKKIEVRPAGKPEVLTSPERSRERETDSREQTPVNESVQEAAAPQIASAPVATVAPLKDPELKKIEDILSEGLGELYTSLPPNVQPAFRAKGEEVASVISGWASEAKLTAKKVLHLIREWLGMAPRLSKHYLEQESKIKTDQIMHLHDNDTT